MIRRAGREHAGQETAQPKAIPPVARHQPLRPVCDAKFGCTVRSRLYDDLYIVPQCDKETHEALDRISPELTSQHS